MIRDSYFVHKKSHEPRLSSKRFREIGEKRKTECFARLKKMGPHFSRGRNTENPVPCSPTPRKRLLRRLAYHEPFCSSCERFVCIL